MSKIRRFAVPTLESSVVGSDVELPEAEARHVRVLRLEHDDEIELSDVLGRFAKGRLFIESGRAMRVRIDEIRASSKTVDAVKLTIATAWPKGKRASFMIEKCAELGVNTIVPLRFKRSVVTKDEESEGVVRLKRIAAEASKQSGRDDVMEIAPEVALEEFLKSRAAQSQHSATLLLDPRGTQNIAEIIADCRDVAMIVGPEGGFAQEEIDLVVSLEIPRVRLAEHVLRIETAAMAAAAICRAAIKSIDSLQ